MPKHREGVASVMMTADNEFIVADIVSQIFSYTTTECFPYVTVSLVFSVKKICVTLFFRMFQLQCVFLPESLQFLVIWFLLSLSWCFWSFVSVFPAIIPATHTCCRSIITQLLSVSNHPAQYYLNTSVVRQTFSVISWSYK